MKSETKRQKFLFQGNWAWPALVGFLVNLFALSGVLAQAPGATKLLFLGNKNIAPVVYLDQETPKGVAVDIVRALAPHLPQPIEIKAMDWLEAQALVARGEADALIQINPTEEREKIYDFSEPLLESQFSIFTRTDKVGIAGISSLAGLQVGVEAGGLPRQLLEKYPAVRLTIIPDFLAGFKLLNAGAIDAVVVDYRVGSYVIAENKLRDIRVSGEPIAFSYSALAVRAGNAKLLAAINNALQIIKTDGSYQKIIDNWKPKEVVFETREQISHRIYYLTILVLLGLLLIAAIWTLTLRKELVKRRAAEERFRQQYSTLSGIINSATALIFSVDRQYRYTSFNQGHAATMKALYGAQIEMGHSLLDYMSVTEDREAARQNLDRALAGEQVVKEAFSGEELRSRQYFQVSHSPIRSDEGITGVAVLAQDMTERKRAEEAQQRLNRELRAISDCNQVLVRAQDEPTLLNDICRIVCEEAGYRMAWVGYAENDAGKTVKPVAWAGLDAGYLAEANITWADTERGTGPGGIAIRSGRTVHVQDFATDPQTVPWRERALARGYRSCIALPLKDESAKVFGVLLIYSTEINAFSPDEIRLLEELAGDLAFGIMVLRTRTEHKQAEQALRRLTLLQRTILDNVAYGVISTNPDGKVTSFNPAAERLLGYTADEVVDKQTPAYWHDPEEIVRHARRLSEELGETIAPGFDAFAARPRRNLPEENEWTFIRKDGKRIPVNLSVTALRGEGGQITGFVGLTYDLTERKRAEAQLRRSERGLAEAQRMAHLGNWELDLASNRLTWSDEIYRIFEIDPEKFGASYDAFLNAIHPDDRELVNRAYTDSVSRKVPYDIVHRLLMKDARVKYVNEQCETYYGEDGKPLRSVGTVHDITELKRAEQALQERERHSQSLLHLSRNLEHSQSYAEVLQAAQGEVANIMGYRNLWVYLLSEDKAHLKALVASGPESGVVMSEEGTATLTIAGDKMLEEIAQAKEIVVVEDAQTDPRVNKEIVTRMGNRTIVNVPIILSGRHLGSVGVGTFGEEGVRIPSASEQRYLGALASHMAAALDRIQLLAARQKDAQELLRYKDHLEEQVQHRTADLVLARNAAEAANRAKSVFLSSMSHELRTPLNAILGFSNMMRKDALLKTEQRQHLDIINRSGEHLLNLINDVLEMAKIEAGRVQVEKVPFDLGSLVRDVTDMMHVRAREKGLQLRIDQSSEFPRYIRGDQGRLRQVLINLLGNAVKFTRQGAVTVRLGLKPHAKPQRLLIEVQDSGIGISADDQKRVFEPFVQFGETAAQQGTGLGLSISRQFVQLMGGTISFESTLGQGSTFRLELPMERVAAAEVLKPQGADRGEIVGLAPDQPIYRILIVEDQLDNQLLLTKLMKNVGFEVKVAPNGAQALSLFQSWRPHLIWMDRRMPVMDGLEATRRIRELAAGAEVKIVAVTASVFTEQRDELLQAGMDDFVRKPYRFNEIYDCMARQLGVRYRYAQARAEEDVSNAVLTSEMLAPLPPDRRGELHAALESLDGERISAVLAQIASLDSKLHKTLSQLIGNFDYPAILKALQTYQPAKPI